MTTDDEIHALVRSFEDCTLPRGEWTHREHLGVALYYVRRHTSEEAAIRIRQGIQRFNLSHGNSSGYHETITLAWIEVVRLFLEGQDRYQPLSELVDKLIGECGDKNYLLRFYSSDRLMSDEARRTHVSPDLRAITR